MALIFTAMRIALLLLLLLFLAGALHAQQARFIGPAGDTSIGKVILFGTTVEADGSTAAAWVGVSADHRYKLFVNGQMVSFGPAHGDVAHYQVDSVNIGPYLLAGRNNVSATVYHYPDSVAPVAQVGLRPGFYLQPLAGAPPSLATGTSWQVRVLGTFVSRDAHAQIADLPGYYGAPPPEARSAHDVLIEHAWHARGYRSKATKPVVETTETNPLRFSYNYGRILEPTDVARPYLGTEVDASKAAGQVYKLVDGKWVKTKLRFPLKASGEQATYLIDAGAYQTAFPFVVSAGNGLVTLGYAEGLYIPGGKAKANRNVVAGKVFKGITDQLYASADSARRYEPHTWRAFRYLMLEVKPDGKPTDMQIIGLGWRATHHPQQLRASIAMPAAPWLGKVLQTSYATAQACAHDTYMDCPYYERLQYTGDTRLQALYSYYNTGEYRLARHALRQYAASVVAEGLTQSRYPARERQLIPPFSLLFVGMVEDYAMHVPDSATVRALMPAVRSVMGWFAGHAHPDGRALQRLPWWNFTDWARGRGWHDGICVGDTGGYSAILDLQYLLALQAAARLEDYVGAACYADAHTNAAANLAAGIIAHYYRPADSLFADTRAWTDYSQHTQALAVLAGLGRHRGVAPAKAMMAKTLVHKPMTQCTIYFSYYLHRALAAAGMSKNYLEQLQPWQDQLALGLTTWAEEPEPSRSDCHAWGSHPGIEVYRQLAGIEPAGWGFAKVRIRPAYGLTRDFEASMPHPAGNIRVAVSRGKMLVQLPPGVVQIE